MVPSRPSAPSLTAALIRRSPPADGPIDAAPWAEMQVPPRAGWRDDLRLFALTWLAGFVFFLVFLA